MKRTIQLVKNYLWHLPKAVFWNLVYGFPGKKIKLIGVTGTDGKTTTVTLIHQLLTQNGLISGLISTVTSPGLHTTSPSPRIIQKTLKNYLKSSHQWAVLEVTAHGIDQFRFWGCHFAASVITNLSHEHLDDFGNLNTYADTKFKLASVSDVFIANADDPLIASRLKNLTTPQLTFSVKSPSRLKATKIKVTPTSLSFQVGKLQVVTDTPYQYQVYNLLSALCVSRYLKIDDSVYLGAVNPFPAISGRRQEVQNSLGIKCVIDFAHTPQALEATLSSLRLITSGRLILIFGATGGRDPSKRPLMGKVISKLANLAILTTDDLRHEKLADINRAIISGFEPNPLFSYQEAENRQLAFDLALKVAKRGDVVVACGKGHETTLLIGDTEYPWSEVEAFNLAIKKRLEP